MRLVTALLIVYLVWGTTYHALNLAMQTLPPLLMNGTRFLEAGAAVLALAFIIQGQPVWRCLQPRLGRTLRPV